MKGFSRVRQARVATRSLEDIAVALETILE